MRYKQTESKYKNIKLGFGDGSIYDVGCYLVSLVSGLNDKGYSFSPEGFNNLLKEKGGFIGEYKNYINVTMLDKYFPDIFISFQQIEPWNDIPTTQELLNGDLIVVCKVDAKAIGGSGTHFVLFTGIENGIAKIWDPWSGVEELITRRWGHLGNILGIRIFKVKPSIMEPPVNPMDPITDMSTKIDFKGLRAAEGEQYEIYKILTVQEIASKFVAKDRKMVDDAEKIKSLLKQNEDMATAINKLTEYFGVDDISKVVTKHEQKILEAQTGEKSTVVLRFGKYVLYNTQP